MTSELGDATIPGADDPASCRSEGWDHPRSSGVFLSAHPSPSGIIWVHLGSFGTIWGPLGSAWVICSHLGSSELIWAQKLQYLSAKMQSSIFFVNFMKCFGGQVHQVLYLPRGWTDGGNPRQRATNQVEHLMVLKNSTRTLIEIK